MLTPSSFEEVSGGMRRAFAATEPNVADAASVHKIRFCRLGVSAAHAAGLQHVSAGPAPSELLLGAS